MTPSNKTTMAEVLQAIRDAVPSSMELKAGCKLTDGYCAEIVYCCDPVNVHTCSGKRLLYKDICTIGCKYTILGRDLGLADVFLTLPISESIQFWKQGNKIIFAEQGEEETGSYNLTKKAHEQKPAFYQFMHPLLVK